MGWAAGEAAALPEHAQQLRQAFVQAQRVWSGVSLPEDAFAEFVTARLPEAESFAAALAQLRPTDLYLACAAGRRDPRAMAAFESTFLSRVGNYVGRIDGSSDFVADVTQTLRVKLFIGRDGSGKLAQYSGRGTLESWVCAAALRTAHDLLRERSRNPPGDDRSFDVLAASDDVELEILRSRYQSEFREALQATLAAVVGRERTLLRLYFLEELSAARIGLMYGVHETTVLRWIVRVRERLADQVHAHLKQKLNLTANELSDLMALLRSRIEVTVRHLLLTTRRER